MNQNSYSYNQEPLHEPIEVDATFSRNLLGHCRPIDGATDYRLTLDTESLNWYLDYEGDQYV